MSAIYTRYQPKNWREIVGQNVALARLHTLKQTTGWVGNGFFITGDPGTGKSSIARLIAQDLCGGDWTSVDEMDGSSLDVDTVRDWSRRRLVYRPLPPSKTWTWIVNEAQRLSVKVQTELLTLIESERFQVCGCLICTAMPTKRDLFGDPVMASAFASRCCELPLANGKAYRAAVAKRAREIAVELNLDGQPESVYEKLVADCDGNFRQVLSRIASGALKY